MIVLKAVSQSWKYGEDVKRDLRRFIGNRGVVGLRRIRKYLFARFGLRFFEVEFLLKSMCRNGQLKLLWWCRYYVPQRKREEDANA